MAFAQDEEIKETLMMEDESSRFMKVEKSSNLVIDIPILRKLLNKPSFEYILSLVQGVT
jgi:hypothetical protein